MQWGSVKFRTSLWRCRQLKNKFWSVFYVSVSKLELFGIEMSMTPKEGVVLPAICRNTTLPLTEQKKLEVSELCHRSHTRQCHNVPFEQTLSLSLLFTLTHTYTHPHMHTISQTHTHAHTQKQTLDKLSDTTTVPTPTPNQQFVINPFFTPK